jgi:hypothetical protein
MELLQRLAVPRRLAARVWLFTLPSALFSFERRQRIPRMPIGRGRFLGLALIAGGAAVLLRAVPAGRQGPQAEGQADVRWRGLSRFRGRPTVGGALLVLSGLGLLLRSLMLTAYALGLALAFARDRVDLEEPQLLRREAGGDVWEYDETRV